MDAPRSPEAPWEPLGRGHPARLPLLRELPHRSTPARFAAWGEALRAAEAQGLREAYLFVHQPDNRDLPALIEGLEAAVGGLLHRPAPLRQASLFPPTRPSP